MLVPEYLDMMFTYCRWISYLVDSYGPPCEDFFDIATILHAMNTNSQNIGVVSYCHLELSSNMIMLVRLLLILYVTDLHGDATHVILLVNPHKESFVLVVKYTSTIWPICSVKDKERRAA